MFKKPNESCPPNIANTKNNLYKKFRAIIDEITNNDFDKSGYLTKKSYVKVNDYVEEGINDILKSSQNSLFPIIGPTGIGKSFILNYCLQTYYETDSISTNCPELFEKDQEFNLVYYSDFKISNTSILDNINDLFLSKIKSINDFILSKQNTLFVDKMQFSNVNNNNIFSEFYRYPPNEREYQENLQKLAKLLDNSLIKDFIFIFDDIESLKENKQYDLIDCFLKFYEFLNTKCQNCSIKFIFCTRTNTYYKIYKNDFYNTHRGRKPLTLFSVPKLSDIFEHRFDAIKDKQPLKINNVATWDQATDILLSLSKRIDLNHTDLLLNLRNKNISLALNDFVDILTNKQWTQSKTNPSSSFIINEADYYINDVNTLRILAMGEDIVYRKNTIHPLKCILPNPGHNLYDDFLIFLILRLFKQSCPATKFCSYDATNLLSVDDVTTCFCDSFILHNTNNEDKQNKEKHIRKLVESAFNYFEENRMIHRNNDPAIDHTSKYYFTHRGEQIFDLFFSSSILFTIFRDEYVFDENRYKISCSHYLSIETLFEESIKYCEDLSNAEKKLYSIIVQNKREKNYILNFGDWSLSNSFFSGIELSSKIVFKDSNNDLKDKLDVTKEKIENIFAPIETFKNDDSLF